MRARAVEGPAGPHAAQRIVIRNGRTPVTAVFGTGAVGASRRERAPPCSLLEERIKEVRGCSPHSTLMNGECVGNQDDSRGVMEPLSLHHTAGQEQSDGHGLWEEVVDGGLRDVHHGESIIENITDAIYSRKTLCVIRPAGYLQCEWCSTEIQMARLSHESRQS
uniref:Uncharacterized protein n=1 Tax=Knipowitschia caucasica TaxID=637954 RepID=A0AAV2IX57_KNICA